MASHSGLYHRIASQELLLRYEYLAAENRIPKGQIKIRQKNTWADPASPAPSSAPSLGCAGVYVDGGAWCSRLEAFKRLSIPKGDYALLPRFFSCWSSTFINSPADAKPSLPYLIFHDIGQPFGGNALRFGLLSVTPFAFALELSDRSRVTEETIQS